MKHPRAFSFIMAIAFAAMSFLFFGTHVAMAEEAGISAAASSAAPVSTETSAAPAIPTDAKFVSTGEPVQIEKLGIKITPPLDWEVDPNYQGLSLVMQEPEPKTVYNEAMYRRNITVAAIQSPSPIDEKRAETLKAEVTEKFGKGGMVSNFQVLEHRFFNYRGEKDGLLVYTSYTMGEFNMMQLHVLVSGQERQLLVTYNDLAERFSKEETFNKAWTSMVSLEVTGEAPRRYEDLIRYGVAGGVFLLLLAGLVFTRLRRAKQSYMEEADRIYSDNNEAWEDDGKDLPTTNVTGMWHLNGVNPEEEVIASMHDTFADSSSRPVSSVSNFF